MTQNKTKILNFHVHSELKTENANLLVYTDHLLCIVCSTTTKFFAYWHHDEQISQTWQVYMYECQNVTHTFTSRSCLMCFDFQENCYALSKLLIFCINIIPRDDMMDNMIKWVELHVSQHFHSPISVHIELHYCPHDLVYTYTYNMYKLGVFLLRLEVGCFCTRSINTNTGTQYTCSADATLLPGAGHKNTWHVTTSIWLLPCMIGKYQLLTYRNPSPHE